MQVSEYNPSLFKKMLVSFELSFKSLFFGRKWIIYILLALFPLVFTLLTPDRLLGYGTVENAYVQLFLGTAIFFFFTFGCLIISLPFSADEITDHLIDLYIVRPIPKVNLYIARWLAYHLALIIVNIFIAVFYFLFLHIVSIDTSGDLISELFNTVDLMYNNLDIFFKAILLIFYGSIVYGGLFMIIGFIGNRAFTIGVIVALFERFLLSLLFLANEPYLPITNLEVIANELYSPLYTYSRKGFEFNFFGIRLPDISIFGIDIIKITPFIESQLYLIVVGVIFLLLGFVYIRRKEFE